MKIAELREQGYISCLEYNEKVTGVSNRPEIKDVKCSDECFEYEGHDVARNSCRDNCSWCDKCMIKI